jgi:putative addiction module component (TIGR02574 family)
LKTNAERLLREALSLPEDARLDLVVALLESVEDDAPTGEGVGGAWSAEAKRRLAEVRTGAVKPVSWEEAESQIFDPQDGQRRRRRGSKA